MVNNDGNVEELLREELTRTSEEQPVTNQDDTTKDTSEAVSPTYKFNGQDMSAEQLYKEAQSLQAEFTRKSQELATLKDTPQDIAKTEQPTKAELSANDKALREELIRLGFTTNEASEKLIESKRPEFVKEAATVTSTQAKLDKMLDSLETEWNGENGKPKVDRQDILKFIQERNYPNVSPEEIARSVYYKDFVRYEAQQLAKTDKNPLPKTEANGAGVTTPPQPPKYNFSDGSAERALSEFLSGATK